MKSFVDILSERVEAEKINISDLSRITGVPKDKVYKLVKKKNLSTSVESAMQIASYFGQTLDEFMGDHRSGEELEIIHLVSQLTEADRQLLLGFGKGLVAAKDPAQPESDEDGQ